MDYHRYLRPYKRAWVKFCRDDLSQREHRKAEDELYRLYQKVYAPLKTWKLEEKRSKELNEVFLSSDEE